MIIIGQDESVFMQFSAPARGWRCDNEQTLRKKSEGQGIHISAFVNDQSGINPTVTEAQLEEINKKHGGGHEYISADAAQIENSSKVKPPITMAQLDADMCHSPFMKMIKVGQGNDGYWNGNRMKLQFEDHVDCFKEMFPGHDLYYLYDQSSGHTKKIEGGLDANTMLMDHGGDKEMRATRLVAGCIGPFESLLKEGDIQDLMWESDESKLKPGDGPWYLTPEERDAQRYDVFHEDQLADMTSAELRKQLVAAGEVSHTLPKGKKELAELSVEKGLPTQKVVSGTRTVPKTKAEMIAELQSVGVTLPSGKMTKAQVEERMQNHSLSTVKEERRIKTHGWVGKAKGLRQVLWETGWIDAANKNRYHRGATAADLDDDKNVKDECRQFVLSLVMADRPDFKNELTDLEYLAQRMSDENCQVVVIFSPKYHPNIAGEGIEDCWGFAKRILRRTPLKQRIHFDGYTRLVKQQMMKNDPARCMRFRRKCRKYMLGYQEVSSEVVELEEGKTAMSFKDRLDAHA